MATNRYAGPIIDSHIHLWELAGGKYPWLKNFNELTQSTTVLAQDHGLTEFLNNCHGYDVIASVHAEAWWDPAESPVNETLWLNSLDKSNAVATRYIAGVPFGRDDTAHLIAQQAAHSRVKAVRQLIAHGGFGFATAEKPQLALDPAWQAALPHLVEHGLALELLMFPKQAAEVVSVADSFNELTVIVDHLASPSDQSVAGMAIWRDAVELLASRPNVVMKVSSVASYMPERTMEKVTALLSHVVDSFGAHRVMFGTDFPVAALTGWSYAHTMDTYLDALTSLTEQQQYDIFCGTASRIYGIDPDDPSRAP